jgi:hypothetical protein
MVGPRSETAIQANNEPRKVGPLFFPAAGQSPGLDRSRRSDPQSCFETKEVFSSSRADRSHRKLLQREGRRQPADSSAGARASVPSLFPLFNRPPRLSLLQEMVSIVDAGF